MNDQELLELCNEYLSYNPETGVFIWIKAGPMKVVGRVAGNKSCVGYWRIGLKSKRYQAHKLAYLMHYGYIPKLIDHIDQCKTNNAILNLRPCTASQNCSNRDYKKGLYRGVHQNGSNWGVRIRVDNKEVWLGTYKNIHEAARVYNEAATKNHGEFASLNIIVGEI